MADEFTWSMLLQCVKPSAGIDTGSLIKEEEMSMAMAGVVLHHTFQNVGASEEALDIGEVDTSTSNCICVIKNHHATQELDMRPGSGASDMLNWQPGDRWAFRLANRDPWVVGSAANTYIEIWVFQE